MLFACLNSAVGGGDSERQQARQGPFGTRTLSGGKGGWSTLGPGELRLRRRGCEPCAVPRAWVAPKDGGLRPGQGEAISEGRGPGGGLAGLPSSRSGGSWSSTGLAVSLLTAEGGRPGRRQGAGDGPWGSAPSECRVCSCTCVYIHRGQSLQLLPQAHERGGGVGSRREGARRGCGALARLTGSCLQRSGAGSWGGERALSTGPGQSWPPLAANQPSLPSGGRAWVLLVSSPVAL